MSRLDEGLKPCPFCGKTNPFTYISFSCCVLRCECGASFKDSSVLVMYKRGEVPSELEPYTYEPKLLVIQDRNGNQTPYPDHGYVGINAHAAFAHAGITEKWNRRIEVTP